MAFLKKILRTIRDELTNKDQSPEAPTTMSISVFDAPANIVGSQP
jgi:hypothetical protein